MSSETDATLVCRACMTGSKECKNIYHKLLVLGKLTTVATMVCYCTNLKFSENESTLPVNFCNGCIQNLEKFYVFKQMVIKSDKTFRQQQLKPQQLENLEKLNTSVDSQQHQPKSGSSSKKLTFVDDGKCNDDSQGNKTIVDLKKEGTLNAGKIVHTFNKIRVENSRSPNAAAWQCQVCDKQLSNPSSIHYHRRMHSNESPANICDICGKSFRTASFLRTHMRTHSGEKPYNCDICGKALSQKSGYKKHMLTHTGEKPYSCEVCGREFRYSSNLILHKRLHTGEKNYNCHHCEKRFRTSEHLKRHSLVHTGAKPFGCEICSRRFNRQSSLLTHGHMHQNIAPAD